MKKFFVISLICILVLCGCESYVNQIPDAYGAGVWKCDIPEITYTIEMKYSETEGKNIPVGFAKTKLEEEEILFNFGFLSNTVDAWEQKENENGEMEPIRQLFSGTCKYSKTKFIIKVNKDTDILFGGEYDELVFNRVEN